MGYSFIIHHEPGFKHYYHFSAAIGNRAINMIYLQNFDYLKGFISYFTEQINAQRKLKHAYNIKFSLEEKKEKAFLVKPELSLPLNRVYVSHHVYLTQREMECLHWLSSGKTIDEAAIILSITRRTMKAHVANIKNKLGCKKFFNRIAYQA